MEFLRRLLTSSRSDSQTRLVSTWQPGTSERARAVLPLLLLLLAASLLMYAQLYSSAKPARVRDGNRHQRNPYGERGEQRLPHAIVIGVRKAGTRALLNYLSAHPDIRVAPSECHFFADDANYRQGLDFYRRQMPYSTPQQLTLEKTPNYFQKGAVAAERIRAMNSSVRLLVVVREPVTRAVSDYVQFHQYKGERRTFQVNYSY